MGKGQSDYLDIGHKSDIYLQNPVMNCLFFTKKSRQSFEKSYEGKLKVSLKKDMALMICCYLESF